MRFGWSGEDGDGGTDDNDLTVVFHPEGGFNKNGAFTEGKNKEEYERQGFITLEVVCPKLFYARTWGLEEAHEKDEEGEKLTAVDSETLSGNGQIQRSHYGRYALSFLGSPRAHTDVEVSIRKAEQKHIVIVPMKATSDIDLAWDEHFTLDIRLDQKSFVELRDELRANPGFRIFISVKLDELRGLYTTWSPSISEGRVLKFLDNRKDVSNHEDMPKDFASVGFGGDRLPFSISVGERKEEDDESEG